MRALLGTTRRASRGQAGFTINEILFAATITTVVLLASFLAMQRDVQLQRSSISIAVAESKAQAMLFKLERELSNARGESPRATLTSTAGSGDGALQLTSTLGFPDQGFLLIDRDGTAEVASYTGLDALTRITGLDRGQQCTNAGNYDIGDEVMWAGLAVPIANQVAPPAALWDGQAQGMTGTVFFEGLGTGFSYRVPTDETGGNDFLDGDQLRWGESINGAPTLDGWGAVHFTPVWVFSEVAEQTDLNGDGDMADLFDVGQVRRRVWDTSNPGGPGMDIGLGPTVVIQEQCNWGGDLDNDGFEDPMFLWDAERRTLQVRLFVIGTASGASAVVRRVESVIFLRNMAEV